MIKLEIKKVKRIIIYNRVKEYISKKIIVPNSSKNSVRLDTCMAIWKQSEVIASLL